MSKRIRTRVVVHRPVEYRHAGGQGQGILMDLALQGCRIKGASRLPCGARLRLQIWLSDQAEPVMVERAIVRWATGDQVGVSLFELSPDVRARLDRVVRSLYDAQQSAPHVIPVSACFAASKEQNAALPPPEVRVRVGNG